MLRHFRREPCDPYSSRFRSWPLLPSPNQLGDVVPRVNGGTVGGALTWNADATGFWYSRYPRGNERPAADMAFYTRHKLGTKTEDDVNCVGKEFPRIAEIGLVASDDGKYVLVQVANGDGGDFAYWLPQPE